MIKKLVTIKSFSLKRHIRALMRADKPGTAEKSLDRVISIVSGDAEVRELLHRFNAGPGVIRQLYDFLMQGGADRWVHCNYIAALGIANPVIIQAYLQNLERADDKKFRLSFADTCVRYIEGGYSESFLRDQLQSPLNRPHRVRD